MTSALQLRWKTAVSAGEEGACPQNGARSPGRANHCLDASDEAAQIVGSTICSLKYVVAELLALPCKIDWLNNVVVQQGS